MVNHHAGQVFHTGCGFPTKLILCFGGVTEELLHFGRPKVPGVNFDKVGVVQANMFKGQLTKAANRDHGSCGHHIVVGLVLLQHAPHGLDIISRKSPVPLCVEVAKEQFVLQAQFDAPNGPGDFSCDKCFTPSWRLVVEQDAT